MILPPMNLKNSLLYEKNNPSGLDGVWKIESVNKEKNLTI